jgi:hypothetical protein
MGGGANLNGGDELGWSSLIHSFSVTLPRLLLYSLRFFLDIDWGHLSQISEPVSFLFLAEIRGYFLYNWTCRLLLIHARRTLK